MNENVQDPLQERTTQRFAVILDAGILLLCCFSALSFGATEQWSEGLIIAASGVFLAAKILYSVWNGKTVLFAGRIYLPLLLFLGFTGMQTIFLQPGISEAGIWSVHSVVRHTALLYLLLFFSYISTLFLVHNGLHSRRLIKFFIVGLLVLGIFEAGYGLVQYFGGYEYIWNYERKGAGRGVATGTFVNRNHYALFMNLAICSAVGFLFYRSRRLFGSMKLTLRNIAGHPSSAKLVWIILIIALMGLALVFSMSRMGILAMFCTIGVMIAAARSTEMGKRGAVIGIFLLAIVAGLSIYAGIEPVLDRFEKIEEEVQEDKSRPAIWQDAWPMIAKNALFGRGLGSFQWTFPAYETTLPDTPAAFAHNDYLQAIAEVGIVGLGLMLWAAWLLGKTALKNLRSEDPLASGIGLATMGALTAIALQEISDFGLYIPGVAVMAAVLFGLNLRAAASRLY